MIINESFKTDKARRAFFAQLRTNMSKQLGGVEVYRNHSKVRGAVPVNKWPASAYVSKSGNTLKHLGHEEFVQGSGSYVLGAGDVLGFDGSKGAGKRLIQKLSKVTQVGDLPLRDVNRAARRSKKTRSSRNEPVFHPDRSVKQGGERYWPVSKKSRK